MADVTPTAASVTGVAMTLYAAADPLTVSNNGRVLLIAINTSAAERTFQIVTEQVVESDLAVADRVITIPDSQVYTQLGTYATQLYNDEANEITLQTFNDISGLSFLALQT
jgi:hydrogenase maturation factor